MIFVEKHDPGFFSVRFPRPIRDNVDRIKKIAGARFNGQKAWIVPLGVLEDFEELFAGEFIYVTPRHELTGDPPPPPPGMYKKIPRHPVTRINGKLYDYQEFGANFLACIAGGTGHAFLTDKVGTGKTVQSIAGMHIMQDLGLVDSAFVFCKASLKYQWLRDGVKKFTNEEGIVIDGTKKQREKLYGDAVEPRFKYVILNYELLLHDFDLILAVIKAKGTQLFICDEAHKVTNHSAKMNKALKKLVQPNKRLKHKGVPYVFYLTATPMSSKVEQLYGIFSIRRPDFFGTFANFKQEFLKYEHERAVKPIGIQNYDKLHMMIFRYMLRRTDAEIDMDLPELVEMERRVEMTSLQKKLDEFAIDQQEVYRGKIKQLRLQNAPKEVIEKADGALQAMMYVRKAVADTPELMLVSKSEGIRKQFGSVVEQAKDKSSPKLNELADIIDELVVEGGEKLIIFTELETLTRIIERDVSAQIGDLGYTCVTYTGQHSSKQKDAHVLEFKDNPDCKVFIATDAAAEGLNLQFCPYMVQVDLPWVPDKVTQRMGRIQRGGSQYESVKVINLIMEDSIDISILEALENKQNLFNALIENTASQSQAIQEAMYGTS